MHSKNLDVLDFITTLNKIDEYKIIHLSSGNLNQSYRLEDIWLKKNFEFTQILFFIFISIFPIDLFIVFIRVSLRKFFSNTIDIKNFSLLKFSIGERKSKNFDSYLGYISSSDLIIRFIPGFKFKIKDDFFIESFINIKSLFFIPIIFPVRIFIFIKYFKKIKIFKKNKIVFLNLLIRSLNSPSFFNFVINNQIIKTILLHKNKQVLFPMEGRNWEKNISTYAKYSIGVMHTTLTPRHLWLSHPLYKLHELPSEIIVPGKIYKNMINKLYPIKIHISDIFRYQYLEFKKYNNNKLNVLFSLNSNFKELKIIIDRLLKLNFLDSVSFYFRPNPNASNYSQISSFIKKNGFQISYDLKPDICFYRSSAMAINYINCNIPSVYLKLDEFYSHNIFNLTSTKLIKEAYLSDLSESLILGLIKEFSLVKKIKYTNMLNNYIS